MRATTFGNRLGEVRRIKKISQDALAKKIGVNGLNTHMVFKKWIMEAANFNINLPLNFNQVVDLVKQLPYKEKLKLSEVLKKETKHKPDNNNMNDNILTHFASEKVLAKDWLLPEEDEAWKDL